MLVDYTTFRKGTRITKTETIQYCPKCGRKGSHRPGFTQKNGKTFPALYTHKGEVVNIGGFQIFEIKDQCMVREEHDPFVYYCRIPKNGGETLYNRQHEASPSLFSDDKYDIHEITRQEYQSGIDSA